MKRLNLLLACMAAVSIQASATTLFSSMDGPVDLTTLESGSSTKVLVFVGGPGNDGFIYYQGTRFWVPSGKSSFSVNEDISSYVFTLLKTADGNYQLQENVNGLYMPAFVTGAKGNFSSNNNVGTFAATDVASPQGYINSDYIYTLTNVAENGLAVTKTGGALAVATDNGAEFQFYTFTSTECDPVSFPRKNWDIKACSERSGTTAGTDGVARLIIDDDLNTYWHSDWTSTDCTGSSSHANWFLIDCGEEVTFSDFSYTSRASGTNGIFTDYQLFTSTEAISEDEVDTYIAQHEPSVTGTIASTSGLTTMVHLDGKEITARYLLMVRPHTDSNNYGSCADFQIYTNDADAKAAQAQIDAYRSSLETYVSVLSPVIDSSLISAFNGYKQGSFDAETECANLDALAADCFNYLDKQTYYIYNTRRGQYLTAKSANDGSSTNTVAYTTDPAKWQIRQVTSGERYFRLFNPCTQAYISTSVASQTTDESSAQQFYFFSNSGGENKTDNSVSIRLKDSDNGLNVDTEIYHSNLTTWAYNDGGSSWDLSFVATPVSDIQAGSYYRIRSNRGYYNQTGGSLMTVNGILAENGIDNDPVSLTHDGTNAGTIWQLQAVDGVDGGYKLINIIADYDEGQYGLYRPTGTKQQVALSADPATYYLIDASTCFSQKFPNGVAISSENSATGNTCIDVSGDGKPIGDEWHPAISTNDGVDNQGSVFYLEEVSMNDYYNTAYAYSMSLPTTPNITEDAATVLSTVTDLAKVPALYPNAVNLTGIAVDYSEAMGDIAEAIVLYREALATEFPEDDFDAAVADFYAQPIGKHIQFNQGTYWLGADDSSNVINSVADGKTYLSTIWQFEAAPEGSTLPYIVKNVASGKYLGYQTFNSQATYPVVADAADAHIFGFLRNGCGENQVRLTNGVAEGDSNNKNCIYLADGSAKIWGNGVGQTILTVSGVVYDEMEYPATDDNKVSFANVSKNEHCGDLKITLKPISTTSTPAEAPAIRRITAQDDGSYVIDDSDIDENGTITIPNDGTVASGNYLLTVPAGYFVDTDGNLNAEFSDTFTIGESGTVTSIDELTVDALEAAPAAIYDLQGRRVASPRAGQVYIQGGKLRLN